MNELFEAILRDMPAFTRYAFCFLVGGICLYIAPGVLGDMSSGRKGEK